jgi:osmotically-inducible protein OsmY
MKTVNSEIIKKNVFEQLKWNSSVDAENINISVSDGTVWLDGIVKSYVEKISATKDAFHVRGVRHVNNNLEVHLLGESELPDDEQIKKNSLD